MFEEIIKKAIEGGYDDDFGVSTLRFKEYEPYQIINSFKQYILDPLFWQSLGKACGWNKHDHSRNLYEARVHWQYVALKFFDTNLTEGWDKAVEYLSGIIK